MSSFTSIHPPSTMETAEQESIHAQQCEERKEAAAAEVEDK